MLAVVGGLQEHSWQQQIGHLAQVSPGQGQKPGSKGHGLIGLPGRGNAEMWEGFNHNSDKY